MSATTAGRAVARAESPAAANSNRLGCREDRPMPARTSAISLFGFLLAEFIERPRIFRRGSFGLAGDDDDRAVGLDLVAGDRDARLARLLGDGGERRLARLAVAFQCKLEMKCG